MINTRSATSKIISPLHVSMIAGLFLLLAAYVFSANSMTSYGFEVGDLGKRIAELQQQNTALGMQAEQAQSLSNLREKSRVLGLEEATAVSYIEIQTNEPLVFNDQ